MNKTEAQELMKLAGAALAPVADAYGMDVAKTRGGYDDSSIKLTITLHARGAESPEVLDWNRYATTYGLEAGWLGQTITYRSESYTITGLAPSRRKYPVAVTRDTDGQQFFLTVRSVLGAMGEAV